MAVFATEFPVKNTITNAQFLSEIYAWLRGSEHSSVLSEADLGDSDLTYAQLDSPSGEQLIIRVLEDGLVAAIGFRHDLPDNTGRIWRTESVLKHSPDNQTNAFVRFRTQCISRIPNVKTDTPKKPYIIKSIIRENWSDYDGDLLPSDQAIYIEDNDSGINIGAKITKGESTRHLPIIYVSALAKSEWIIPRTSIDRLAYELGGVAHIVVEPSRSFSFSLRDATLGRNVYGGALGLVAPTQGILKRYMLGQDYDNVHSLIQNVRAVTCVVRSELPSVSWDWLDLQEASLRDQRRKEKNRLSEDERDTLFNEELKSKDERIIELERQLNERPNSLIVPSDESHVPASLFAKIGTEIYEGEFLDRIRYSVKQCLSRGDTDGLDSRSAAVFSDFLRFTSYSPNVSELREDLKRASRDPKKAASELRALLSRHGYTTKSDNKHIRLEAKAKMAGLGPITLAKTPSDMRGLENSRKQIEKVLGISRLTD